MIEYNYNDWTKLDNGTQLTEGELYIVYGATTDTMFGVMEYNNEELWGDDIKLILKNRTNLKPLQERGYWIMPFKWPEPPGKCFQASR